jgi:hypothetical protein
VTLHFDGYGTLKTATSSYTVMRIAEDYGAGEVDYEWYTLDPLVLVASYSHNNNVLLTLEPSVSSGTPNWTVPSFLAFDTLAGTSQKKSLTITNNGTAALMLPSLTLRNGTAFSLSDTSVGSIAVGSSATISVTFSPKVSGPFFDTLVIGPIAAPLALVYLSGIGEMGKIEVEKDTTLMQAVTGSSDTEHVTITNHGEVSMMITVALVLNTPTDFAADDLVDPLPIAAGQSANLSVYYSPTSSSAATSSAVVSMTYTDGGLNADTTFVLNGTVESSGVQPGEAMEPITFSPNPASSRIMFDGLAGIKGIRILDDAGRMLLSQKVFGPHATFDVSTLPSGVYTAVLDQTNGNPKIQRLTILH